jgi:large subunit ribosomal protein L31e
MAELLRTYVINLRREFIKAPRYKKTPKAVRGIVTFCTKHMKSEDIRIMPEVNLFLWAHGKKNPPPKVQVDCKRDDKGICYVQLHGLPFPTVKEVKQEGATSKLMDKFGLKAKGKKDDAKADVKTEAGKDAKTNAVHPAAKPATSAPAAAAKPAPKLAPAKMTPHASAPPASKPAEAPKQMGH